VRETLPDFDAGEIYQVTGRSLLLFALHTRGETQRIFDRLEAKLTDSPPAPARE
jgi:isoamylase